MSRSILPQNYTVVPGTVIESFGTFADWTVDSSSNGSIEVDSTYFQVVQSLKVNALATKTATASKAVALNLAGLNCMRVWVYVPDPTYLAELKVRVENTGGDTPRFSAVFDTSAGRTNRGWNVLTMHQNNFTPGGTSPSWNGLIVLKVSVKALTAAASVSFALLTFGGEFLPRLSVQFDDALSTEFTEGFNYLCTQKGKSATIWVMPDWIDTAGYMTSAQLATAYAAGWSLGNHTKAGLPQLDAQTKAEQTTSISYATDWLIARGYARAARHLAYPGGAWNSDTRTVMAELGILSGRGMVPWPQVAPVVDTKLIMGSMATSSSPALTVAQIKAWIDNAIATGACLNLIFHALVTTPAISTDYTIANFKLIIDYAIQRGLKFVTVDEWYNGLIDPRYQSLQINSQEVLANPYFLFWSVGANSSPTGWSTTAPATHVFQTYPPQGIQIMCQADTDWLGMSQSVLEVGATYEYQMEIGAFSLVGDPGGLSFSNGAGIWYSPVDGGGNPAGFDHVDVFTGEFVAQGTTTFKVCFWGDGPDVTIKSISLLKKPPRTPLVKNMISNGEFTLWTDANSPSDWMIFPGASGILTQEPPGHCRIHGDGIGIYQYVLTVGEEYEYNLEIASARYGSVYSQSTSAGIYIPPTIAGTPGTYRGIFTALGEFPELGTFILSAYGVADVTVKSLRVSKVIRKAAANELINNGYFSSWTGGEPDNWLRDYDNTVHAYVTQGVPGCRFVMDIAYGGPVYRYQNILTVGRTYEYLIEVTSLVSGFIYGTNESGGTYTPNLTVGVNTGTFIAATDTSFCILVDGIGAGHADITVSRVSIKEVSPLINPRTPSE